MKRPALLLAAIVTATTALTGSTALAQPSGAPECVTVIIHAYQPDGTFHRTWLSFCGSGPGADSALHDWAQGHRFTLDGALGIGRGCGGKADPCVLFPGG